VAKLVFYIRSLTDLNVLGQKIGTVAEAGMVICLDGNLGTGKTTLAQAIARGLGVPPDCYVTSPSFAIMHEYLGGRLPLYHMDFYRLEDSSEVIDLGFEDYFYGEGVTVIEWSERAKDIIPDAGLHIALRIINVNEREVVVTSESTDSALWSALELLRGDSIETTH